MCAIYDNWERLVAAAVKKQQLWELAHADSRSPSVLSEASDLSSSFNSSSYPSDPAFDVSIPGSSSESQIVIPKFVLISEFSPTFEVNDVKLVPAELLRRGTFGSAYTTTMSNGVRTVVKRLKSIIISEQEFERNMEIVGNIRHDNVAPLRAYFLSKHERVMLYDYYRNGSVFALLHGQSDHVDWETRLRIATGAARGIAEIHSQDGGKFVHGNIKSSNIFLSSQEYGCVSDIVGNGIRATLMPNAFCYAPEVKSTHCSSQKSDVYSFGILLFELLTRNSPVHVPGGPEAVDLIKLVSSVKSKIGASTVFDADLLEHHAIREQIVKALQIGISCVAKSPKKRPKMSDVVKMLGDLRMMREECNVSLEGKLVVVEDSYPMFTFGHVIKASKSDPDPESSLSRVDPYEVRVSAYGDTFMVKKFEDVNVTYKMFRQHMKIIERIRHRNVAQVRAYYLSMKEVFLVYEFYDRPCLSSAQHGNSSWRHFQWKTRLKIAVGVARGIAHIHNQDNHKLVHGNIKPTNIFVNGEGYGVVSGAGLEIVMNPTRQQASGYSAPEVEHNKNVSQAYDVYSFGVVLLLLLSGRSVPFTTVNGVDYDGDGGGGGVGGGDGVASLVNWIQSFSCYEWTTNPDIYNEVCTRIVYDDLVLLKLAMDCVAMDPTVGLR